MLVFPKITIFQKINSNIDNKMYAITFLQNLILKRKDTFQLQN